MLVYAFIPLYLEKNTSKCRCTTELSFLITTVTAHSEVMTGGSAPAHLARSTV